jgi:hypothetical protein
VRTRGSLGGTNNYQHHRSHCSHEHEETEQAQDEQFGLTDAECREHRTPQVTTALPTSLIVFYHSDGKER